jgi:phosphohistidine phosphatase
MRIYVIRHGKAEADSPTGRDADRPLKPRGVRQAKFLGEQLATIDRPPAAIITSGFARAIHTATVIQAGLNCRLDTARGLECDRPVGDAIEVIREQAELGVKTLAIVGHNPQLSELLATLLPPGSARGASDDLIMKTGECVAIECRVAQPYGSGRIVARLRLEEDDDTSSSRPEGAAPDVAVARATAKAAPTGETAHARARRTA